MRWIEEHGVTIVFALFVLVLAYKLYTIQSGMNAISSAVGGGSIGTPAPLDDGENF